MVNAYNRRTAIRSPFNASCDGSCTAKILAAAVALEDCTEFTKVFDTSQPMPDPSSGMTNKVFDSLVVDIYWRLPR